MASGRHVAYVAQWAGWRTHQRIIAERLNAADAGKALPHPERARSRSSPTPLVIQRSGPPLRLSQARQKPANREVDGRAIATLLGLAATASNGRRATSLRGAENITSIGQRCGGVAACRGFAILATTAERREAF